LPKPLIKLLTLSQQLTLNCKSIKSELNADRYNYTVKVSVATCLLYYKLRQFCAKEPVLAAIGFCRTDVLNVTVTGQKLSPQLRLKAELDYPVVSK